MTDWTIPNLRDHNEWFYFKVNLTNISQDDEIDLVTWKQVLLKALRNFYGLIGESMHFDLLHTVDSHTVIVRCQKDDRDTFANAILMSSGTLDGDKYSLTTLARSSYLNGVV